MAGHSLGPAHRPGPVRYTAAADIFGKPCTAYSKHCIAVAGNLRRSGHSRRRPRCRGSRLRPLRCRRRGRRRLRHQAPPETGTEKSAADGLRIDLIAQRSGLRSGKLPACLIIIIIGRAIAPVLAMSTVKTEPASLAAPNFIERSFSPARTDRVHQLDDGGRADAAGKVLSW